MIGVYSPKAARAQALAEKFADSEGGKSESYRNCAEELIAKDESEEGTDLGQNVRKAFPLADAFVTEGRIDEEVNRVLALLFGAPYKTPSKDEQGMFFAQAAALRSAALARQVGACVTTAAGDVLAVRCNEVPRAGGGQYWPGDEPDGRDFAFGHDRNDRLKVRLLREVLSEIKGSAWVVERVKGSDLDQLLGTVLAKERVDGEPWLRETRVGSLTEFGRDVHAEMAALLAIARQSTSAVGATLYTTTFPCHNCAKHILTAGIVRVVFVEPYPKSFAVEFHAEAFSLEGAERDMSCGKVILQPFSGVAPRKYLQWFQARKHPGSHCARRQARHRPAPRSSGS